MSVMMLAGCIYVGVSIHHAMHTFVWFNTDLPSPEEVAGWDEHTTKDTLYKLSRWNNFEDGEQFKQLVLRTLRPLGKNASDRFHFLEVGLGVGAFAREILDLFPLSTGVGTDIVPATIEIAKVVLPAKRMTVMVGDMQSIESAGSTFHVVFVPGALCLLFSMGNVRSAVDEFHRVLKPGGGVCISLMPTETSSAGACNTRIPKTFWSEEMVYRYGFTILSMEDMDDWHLPHSMGRYSVCMQKPAVR